MRISDVGTIELEGMEFHAYHGCYNEERVNGNLFVVDFSASVPMKDAAESDDLDDTIDYGRIYAVIAEQMSTPSNLLEHVAARIVNAIAEAFPTLEHFSVRVSKKNPPVGGNVSWARVTLNNE